MFKDAANIFNFGIPDPVNHKDLANIVGNIFKYIS